MSPTDLGHAAMAHRIKELEDELERLLNAKHRDMAEMVSEVGRLRHWIDTVGRTCPSSTTINDFLLGNDR